LLRVCRCIFYAKTLYNETLYNVCCNVLPCFVDNAFERAAAHIERMHVRLLLPVEVILRSCLSKRQNTLLILHVFVARRTFLLTFIKCNAFPNQLPPFNHAKLWCRDVTTDDVGEAKGVPVLLVETNACPGCELIGNLCTNASTRRRRQTLCDVSCLVRARTNCWRCWACWQVQVRKKAICLFEKLLHNTVFATPLCAAKTFEYKFN